MPPCDDGNESSGPVKVGKFVHQLNDCQLIDDELFHVVTAQQLNNDSIYQECPNFSKSKSRLEHSRRQKCDMKQVPYREHSDLAP